MITLCLDPGIKHTGISISTDDHLAQPLTVIDSPDLPSLVSKLKIIISQHKPDKIIIGQPSYGTIVEFARNLQTTIQNIFTGPIILYPEDLSSKMSNKLKSKNNSKHHLASAIILQEYLDSRGII